MNETLFARAYLETCWAKDYEAYCASEADADLLNKLRNWADRAAQKETTAEKALITLFFEDIWGYASAGMQAKGSGHNLYPQFPIDKAGQAGGVGKADLAIGWFGRDDVPPTPQVLCEFKDERSGLDDSQNRIANNRSPVKQCADYLKFSSEQFAPYGNEKIQPVWGIVTDMNEFRLYWKAQMPRQYERFVIKKSNSDDSTIVSLLGENEQARKERFMFSRLFHKSWLLSTSGEPPLLALLNKQWLQESKLEKHFYFEYRDYRLKLFQALLQHNPEYQSQGRKLVRLTQKLLDRFLFILFCEDMGPRLEYPQNLLRDILCKQSCDENYDPETSEFWDGKLKRLFKSMREGGIFSPYTINCFNGGLFAADSDLDSLIVPDKIFCAANQGANAESLIQHKNTLLYFSAHYNFGVEDGGERAVGLYTLGRIFEQSITDLEILEAEAANETSLMKLSKRKTDGVYYTPEWVTAYIVEETLGAIFKELRTSSGEAEFASIDATQVHEDHTLTRKFRNKQVPSARYFEWLLNYEKQLGNIKVLDPACGSGAFLIQALKCFVAEYEYIAKEKARISYAERQSGLFNKAQAYRAILGKNLFGVDINAESVEITKLALWLHTALPGQPLSSLNDHIVCGNSLVDWDIETSSNKLTPEQKQRINPFSYATAFKDVFAKGGFDVIIGNPPYIKLQNMRQMQPEATDYWVQAKDKEGNPKFRSTQTGNYDIYLPFIEQGCRLLKSRGKMGFINPNVWAVNEYGQGLREWLHSKRYLDRWVDFKSYQIFEEAITYTALQFFNGSPTAGVRLAFAPNGNADLASLNWDEVKPWSWDELPRSTPWEFMTQNERLLIAKLHQASTPLIQSCNSIFQGLITSADQIYHLSKLAPGKYLSYADKNNPVEIEIEDGLMRPLISGPEAKRYLKPRTNTWLLFPYSVSQDKSRLYSEEELQTQYPKGWMYLKQHEVTLRARESRKFDDEGWYQFGRSQNIDKQETPKLIVAQTVPSMRVCYDDVGECYLNNVRVNGIIPKNPEDGGYLLAVLNAPPADYVFKRTSKVKEGGYYEANKQFIAPLPIPTASPAQKSELSTFAGDLQELRSKCRDETQELSRLIAHEQMATDGSRKSPQWIWPDLPSAEALKKSDAAGNLKGAALTRWAKEREQELINEKLNKLNNQLTPNVKLAITDDDGEVALLANGVEILSVFEDDKTGPLIAAQWRQVIRTTAITPSVTAIKLLELMLSLRTTSNTSLQKKIVDLDAKLEASASNIASKEAEINKFIYGLYGLTPAEIQTIERG